MLDETVPSVGESDLEVQICALEGLDLQGLRAAWRRRWGMEPKLRSRDLLRRLIAWKIQAEAEGGLSSDVRARLRSRSMPRVPLPKPGTKLTREYMGVLHEAEVGVGTIHFAGKSYGSLSEVAREITGTRWNGPRFFGLRDGARP
jgi:hypothetical protein